MKTKNGNSKNINVTAFKKQLSITFFLNLVFKHDTVFRIMLLVSNHAIECCLCKC